MKRSVQDRRRLSRGFWFAAFVLAGAAVAVLQTATSPGFDPAGMTYVDIARHIAKGHGIAAGILYPSHVPKMPSPISLWPPLYPAAIAGLSLLGVESAIASRVVSIVAFGVSVGLVWVIGSVLFDERAGAVAALLLAAWPTVTGIAAMALSENLFVLLVLLSVLFSVRVIHGERSLTRSYVMAAAGGLAMAGAALTRYPGLVLMAIGGVALLLSLRGRAWGERLAITFVWSSAAFVPVALLLLRNRLVTGAFMGTGRLPDDSGFFFHAVFAAKTVAADGLKLLWRIAIAPEVLRLNTRVMALAVLGAGAALLFGLVRSDRVRGGLVGAMKAAVGSRERAFVAAMGMGYWVAMVAIRSVTSFEPLNTRMMMPAYPLVLIGVVGVLVTFSERMGLAPRFLLWVVAALFVCSVALVVLPQSVRAGGPRLTPDPPPVWVTWVAANTPPDAPIVGNRPYEFNFYLQRPVYSFQVFAVYRTGDRFDRDCRVISSHLTSLGWKRAYLVLHAEEGEFGADVMGRRYGPTIAGLLRGELPLPVRPVTRQPEFAVFEILESRWNCDRG